MHYTPRETIRRSPEVTLEGSKGAGDDDDDDVRDHRLTVLFVCLFLPDTI
jgi:hypothetical protein